MPIHSVEVFLDISSLFNQYMAFIIELSLIHKFIVLHQKRFKKK